ncbi:uncharacterized protein LOC123512207 [Portunus trituberculatus]|uniref:uncharacterized protein LOC123512207 n=1 Tax=Portunus trituberculatus TaxID=210409 RepID=UPI001E1CE530|nr:uncharacterized protein LOC123512207 [Portunus trituberculatus]
MRLRLKHSLGSMSDVAVYAPTEVCETEEETFYAKLDSVLDQCPCRDALNVLGDFNAVTGTERAGYELCVGPYGSGTRNDNSSFLLNLARSRRLRTADSWYQRSALHRWLVATLKLHVKSRKPPRCDHTVFHPERLKDLKCAQEYVVTVSNRFGVLDTLENPVEL